MAGNTSICWKQSLEPIDSPGGARAPASYFLCGPGPLTQPLCESWWTGALCPLASTLCPGLEVGLRGQMQLECRRTPRKKKKLKYFSFLVLGKLRGALGTLGPRELASGRGGGLTNSVQHPPGVKAGAWGQQMYTGACIQPAP